MKKFDQNILLRLRRKYSKDEAFKFVSDQLSKAQMEIGYLKSELAELEHVRHDNKQLKNQIKGHEYMLSKLDRVKEMESEISRIKQELEDKEAYIKEYKNNARRVNKNKLIEMAEQSKMAIFWRDKYLNLKNENNGR